MHLNQAIKREHSPFLRIEEVTARMPNANVFLVLDTKSGPGPLDKPGSYSTCVHLPHHTDDTLWC